MNLILFEEGELEAPLSFSDPRAAHLKKVLRREKFEDFDAGIVNGPRGKAQILEESNEGYRIGFTPTTDPSEEEEALYPFTLAVGAVRPQTAKKILREITSLGIGRICFFGTEKGEKAYLKASIYREEAYRPQLIEGTQQAFCTRLPEVTVYNSLKEAAGALPTNDKTISLALDNYEAESSLNEFLRENAPSMHRKTTHPAIEMVIWIGSERGWSGGEREFFRKSGTRLLSLGTRVLRTETAATAAAAISLSSRGYMD